MADIVNWVVCHRPFPVSQVDMYRKLCVGGYYDDISASETEGQNIAQYNPELNELTALYWIWKNTKSEYVGLSHYRRFLFDNGKRMDAKRAEEILRDHDIILAPIRLKWNLMTNIDKAVGDQFFTDGYHAFRTEIDLHQPEYLQAFIETMRGDFMYYCNLFMARREIVEEYCKWLFSFLTDAADRIDVSQGNDVQKRTAGYFGEVMWTVWLRKHHELKVYEANVEVVG